MPLVAYSDSEGSGSESEAKPIAHPTAKSSTNPGKHRFKKVVDRSNPHKIRVNLPEPSHDAAKDESEEHGPPQKKVKLGSGASSGFNSLLPAPKRNAATNGQRTGGLGKGVSLKTGATPGFSRETVPSVDAAPEESSGGLEVTDGDAQQANISTVPGENAPESEVKEQAIPRKGNAKMFKPLSVARKPKQKKTTPAESASTTRVQAAKPPDKSTEAVKRPSLFSSSDGKELLPDAAAPKGEYKPMLYEYASSEGNALSTLQDGSNPYTGYGNEDASNSAALNENHLDPHNNPSRPSQSLDNIAADLNLSASAKRQLLGRNKNNVSGINIVNFDIDREYAANEMLRQAGEQAEHNPVRAIAPGKHSLKQLVNAATNQKDALEEHFASGRRNKKEAGSKYGW